MTVRWGRRSTGGVVKPGHGGWSLTLGFPPTLSYMDPDTGNAATSVGWNLLRSYRRVLRTFARWSEKHRIAERHGHEFADEWEAAKRDAEGRP